MRPNTHLLILTTILWSFTSCQTTDTDDSIISEEAQQLVTTRLHLDFTTTESDWTRATVPDGSPSAITRASAAESAVSRIALTILDSQGNKAIEKTQRKTDTDFGTFHLYLMANAFPLTTDIKVETLDSEGTPISTRTYTDITFNRAKVRTLNTNLFTGTTSGTLTFEEWTSEDPITIE